MTGIYARVSTEEQARKGFSLQDQIRECKKKSGSDEVISYIDEGISGEFLDRPALTRLRQDIRKGLITRVICLDPDRLSRKLGNQILLADEIESKAALIFVNGEYAKTPEGILFFQMRGAISEFEKAKITERMSRGRREKARQGKVVKDYHIYGYDYNRHTCQFIINEAEASIVHLIFKLFVEGNLQVNGINGIANYLTQKGIPTKKRAKTWSKQVVRQILLNRAYIGEFYQNRWNTEGMLANKHKSPEERISLQERPKDQWILVPCPPIIEKEIFDYAQNILEESRRRWAGTSKHHYLLSGLLRCGICGNTMTGRKSKNWGKYVYEYSDRKNTAGSKHKGCGMRMRTQDIEQKVWDAVVSLLANPHHIQKEEKSRPFQIPKLPEEEELEQITLRLNKIRKMEENLLHTISYMGDDLDGTIIHTLQQNIHSSKEEKAQLEKRLEILEKNLNIYKQTTYPDNLTQEAVNRYLIQNDMLTHDDKRELIRSLVHEIIIFHDEIHIKVF